MAKKTRLRGIGLKCRRVNSHDSTLPNFKISHYVTILLATYAPQRYLIIIETEYFCNQVSVGSGIDALSEDCIFVPWKIFRNKILQLSPYPIPITKFSRQRPTLGFPSFPPLYAQPGAKMIGTGKGIRTLYAY